MNVFGITRTRRVETEAQRLQVLEVLSRTYLDEKGWVREIGGMFPDTDLGRDDISWFIAVRAGEPVGVLRLHYDPLASYAGYQLDVADPQMDLMAMVKGHKIAEIGRFAVVPERRNGVGVALSLMRTATREVVARGYSKLVTDVFENDPHSPLGFHTRIIGFTRVATHEHGELLHKGRRVTLMLDMKAAYQRLKTSGNRFFKSITRGWTAAMHASLT